MSALQSEVLTLNFLSDSRQTPAAITKHFCVFFFFSFQWPKGSSNMNSPENLNSSNMSNDHWKQRNPVNKTQQCKKVKVENLDILLLWMRTALWLTLYVCLPARVGLFGTIGLKTTTDVRTISPWVILWSEGEVWGQD